MGTDIAYRSAVELAGAIAEHRVSPVEVMEETLRILFGRVEEPQLTVVRRAGDEISRREEGEVSLLLVADELALADTQHLQ